MDDNIITLGVPTHKVWEIARMPSSTLDYWVRTNVVSPSYRQSEGRRVERVWSVSDVVAVCALRALRCAGASLGTLRTALLHLREWGTEFASARLLWDGTDVVLIVDEDTAVSVVARPSQGVMLRMSLPLGQWELLATANATVVVDLEQFSADRTARRESQQRRKLRVEGFDGDEYECG